MGKIGKSVVAIFIIIFLMAAFTLGYTLGYHIGLGQSQPDLDVGEYQLFYLAPNPLDENTMIAIVQVNTKGLDSPLYVTLDRKRFEGGIPNISAIAGKSSQYSIEVTKVTDSWGTRTIYRVLGLGKG